ncbi:MAG: PDZ domain-containing protein [Solirubrobacterales bacterium]|nr:PDZ domain-containing protein [Solirubrobacterales bacterium]
MHRLLGRDRRPVTFGLTAGALLLALGVSACAESGTSDPVATGGGEVIERKIVSVSVQPSGEVFNPAEIYERTADGVVAINAVFDSSSSSPFQPGAAQGSGFVLNGDGEIVTNAHVISEGEGEDRTAAQRVFVEFRDRNVVPAEVVGFDPFTDTGLIKVDPSSVDLVPLNVGDSDRVVVGEPLAVIGSPFGEDSSLSTGVVSQIGRSVRSLTDFQIEGAIQTDASINPGNSGGPMLDAAGRVIGISQQIVSRSGANDGVGFGVPINSILQSVEQLQGEGEANYAYIGVSTQPIYPQLADKLGLGVDGGALIAEVVDGGPADKAGIRGSEEEITFQGTRFAVGGDVVVEADGKPVDKAEDLGRIIAALTPGETVELVVVRDGSRETIEIELGERPTAVSQP